MGTEVLRPQDILADRFRVPLAPFDRRRNYFPKGNRNGHAHAHGGYQKKKFANQQRPHHNDRHDQEVPNTKQSSPVRSQGPNPARQHHNHNNNNNVPVVTLLRRGESLDSLNSMMKRERKRVLSPPPPKGVPSPADVYAGSAFSMSPAPSSLPLPTFFRKPELKTSDDSATRDLRRLLRLE